tara:strand:- start:3566 stop:3898 length:333 start_codon:yes stop_codon:yes gene_type:complete
MIDTDKYEGHTRGPWKWSYSEDVVAQLLIIPNGNDGIGNGVCIGLGDADAQLIADAPLLLAEVKSWRDSYIDLWNICIELYDGDIELHRFKDWLDERSGGDLYPMKHKEE